MRKMKLSPSQHAALSALLSDGVRLIQHGGGIGGGLAGPLWVGVATVGALLDRNLIARDVIEYAPERVLPPSAVSGRKEETTITPVKRVTYRITAEGRAAIGAVAHPCSPLHHA